METSTTNQPEQQEKEANAIAEQIVLLLKDMPLLHAEQILSHALSMAKNKSIVVIE